MSELTSPLSSDLTKKSSYLGYPRCAECMQLHSAKVAFAHVVVVIVVVVPRVYLALTVACQTVSVQVCNQMIDDPHVLF